MQTYCTLMQTCADIVKALCRLIHVCIWRPFLLSSVTKLLTVPWFFAGPTWRQRDGSVLVASRRFDGSRSRKTKGSLADTLQCKIWRRAQSPDRMTHSLHGGDNHGVFNGFAALGKAIGTPDLTDKDRAYVTEHPVLKYRQPKLANFLLLQCAGESPPGGRRLV
jgi:hypothetical protein